METGPNGATIAFLFSGFETKKEEFKVA